jgi:ComF family protein
MSILPYPAALSRLTRHAADLLLPASCLLCGGDSKSEVVCAACAGELPQLTEQRCPLCADRTTHGERCGACLKDPPAFTRTLVAYRYDYPLDRIVHALKYGLQLAVAGWCADQLAPLTGDERFDRILPLPLHDERLRERGFNQSGEIAKALGRRLDLPVDLTSLLRTRATPPQAELPHKERLRNVRGAFECRTDLTGQHLLLIDDVMTTGATANECARILKLHGAASVTVAVVARALKD